MEKFIELLNEYEDLSDAEECEKWYIDEYDRISEGGRRSQGTNNWICSKKFGFIKRLVDNDKIDIDKYYEFMTNENIDISNACGELDMDKEFYYELLMILAVQDNSIEFLISILK